MTVERSDAAGLALFHCALASRTQVFIRSGERLPARPFSCVCVRARARESTAVYVR